MRVLLLTVPLAGLAWKCADDASCQLNGRCEAGVCVCEPQWRGSNCSEMNLGRSWKAYTGSQPNTSTWGGRAILGEDGLYHGYFAEMLNHCKLDTWTQNSATVHAVASSPVGPFSFKESVQQPWSHNPLVTRDPATGDWLIAHIGCGEAVGPVLNCSGVPVVPWTSGPAAKKRRDLPPCGCTRPGDDTACQTLQVLRSPSPEGPWEDAQVAWPLQTPGSWPGILSNPSLLFVGNLTFLGFNGNLAPPDNHGPSSHPGLLVSESGWRGPYEYVHGASGENYLTSRGYAEDIDLYQDRLGNFHVLMHVFYDKFPGAHGWSRDGLHWEFSDTAAYTYDVTWAESGERATLGKRERPQVLLIDGMPAVLYNGARDKSGSDHTYNMATEILGSELPVVT